MKNLPFMMTERTEASGAGATGIGVETFDRSRALELTEGDEELLRDLILLFKEECVELMEQLESAMNSGDCDSLRKAAHRLKGASASVGGQNISAMARTLETMGALGSLVDAGGMVVQLQGLIEEYNRLTGGIEKESQ